MSKLSIHTWRLLSLLLTMCLAFSGWASEPLLQLNQSGFGERAPVLLSSGMFCGILLLIALYNLFIFWHSRTLSFLFYGLYGLFIFIMTSAALGLQAIIWHSLLWYQLEITLICGAFAAIFTGLFADHLLESVSNVRPLKSAIRAVGAVVLFALLVMMVSWYWLSLYLMVLAAFAMSLLQVSAGVVLWRNKTDYGLFYTLAWSFVALGFAVTLMLAQGWLSWPVSPLIPLLCGLIVEVVLISFVLAGSFSDAHGKLVEAHAEAMACAQEAQQLKEQAEHAQEEATEKLERKVQERTFELEVTLRELEETNRRLEEQSTVDFLTGVKNRKHFDKRYIAECRRSRREQTALSVIMLDIDHFKSVNDTHGHLVGDEVIRQVAHQIQAVIKRPSDVLTRYGGEEFAVILPATPMEGAIQVAEEVVKAVRNTSIITTDGALSVTISAGVSCAVAQPPIESENLLAAADQALYMAKSAGRNQAKYLAVESRYQTS